MKHVYLDISNDVIAESKTPRTLLEAQASNANIIAVISEAPDTVLRKGKVNSLSYHRHTSGDGTDISHYTEIPYLDDYKNVRIQEIELRTTELANMGFTYDDHTFSMSNTFATVYSNLMLLDQKDAVIFPIPLHDLDRVSYPIPDRQTLRTLLAYASAAIMDLQEGDVQLRDAILAATTQEEVDAVVDERTQVIVPTSTVVSVDDFTSQTLYEEEDEKETSTTATTPKKRAVLSVTDIADGSVWDFDWYFEYKSARSNSKAYSSIYVGETEIAIDHTQGEDWKGASGRQRVTLTAGNHDFVIAYWSSSNRYAASIRRIQLRLTRKNEV